MIQQGIFQGFSTVRNQTNVFVASFWSYTVVHRYILPVFKSTPIRPSFCVVVIATASIKPQGVGLVCFPQQGAETPSSRLVAANRSASRGRPPRRETGSSNSALVAVHLSGSAPSYVKQDGSWTLMSGFLEGGKNILRFISMWVKITAPTACWRLLHEKQKC